MSTHDIKALARRWYEELWNTGNVALADELLASIYLGHDPMQPDLGPGPEGVKHFISMFRTAFPDFYFTIEDQISEDDKVLTRWTVRGTHQDSFMGVPPSGRTITMTGMTLHRIEDNQIVESWHEYNNLGLIHQLGVSPMPTSPQQPNPEVTD